MTPATLPSRFAAKTMAATCTVWIGSTNSKGYGLIAATKIGDGRTSAYIVTRAEVERAKGEQVSA